MRAKLSTSALVCCALLFCEIGLAQSTASLAGTWIAELSEAGTTNGVVDPFRMVLRQNGSELSGSGGGLTLSGSITQGRIELRAPIGPEPNRVFIAKLERGEIIGEAETPLGSIALRAYREKVANSKPRVHDFKPTQFYRHFSGLTPPALTIAPGDTVRTFTVDALGVDASGVRRSSGGNPQTGPFYVEGALPGDTLVVHLLKVRLNRDTAISTAVIAASALDPSYHANLKAPEFILSRWNLDREQGVARLATPTDKLKGFTVPLRPMVGGIGVAPPERMSYRTSYLGAYGGNLDYNRLTEGSTVYLPIFQEGALLFIGDGHAAQGAGELAGNALETSLDVEFKVELLRNSRIRMPRAEDSESRMAMGIGGSLDEALRQATTNMAEWLTADFGLNRSEVASVMGTALHYDIAEVVDPAQHVVARIDKRILEQIPR
jgi:acetamidase/formamidase